MYVPDDRCWCFRKAMLSFYDRRRNRNICCEKTLLIIILKEMLLIIIQVSILPLLLRFPLSFDCYSFFRYLVLHSLYMYLPPSFFPSTNSSACIPFGRSFCLSSYVCHGISFFFSVHTLYISYFLCFVIVFLFHFLSFYKCFVLSLINCFCLSGCLFFILFFLSFFL